MIRMALVIAFLTLTASGVRADANLLPLTGPGSKPDEYGYAVRTVEHGKKVTVYIELSAEAAKAFGHCEMTLTKSGNTVVETTASIVKDGNGKGVLKLTLDTNAVDGGELVIWSAPIKDAPPVHNFGGFRLSVAELLADGGDRADAVMKAMDGFRKKLPEPIGLNEQNGRGVTDIDGQSHTDTHLAGIAKRLEVTTKTECLVLMTYLKDPDPKIRRIAAFAIESVVKAYPNGMSSENIQKVDSEGHRKMVKAFLAGIEKLPK